VRTWVFGIALRVAKDHRRVAKRSPEPVEHAGERVGSRDCPEENAARLEAADLLGSIMQGMEDEQRAILVLVELEGLPVADAAAAMNLNPSTAYKRLRAAHQALEAAWVRHQARDRWRLKWET
jgi:RNA polymerase sigma-70 factor, ECF subfamily